MEPDITVIPTPRPVDASGLAAAAEHAPPARGPDGFTPPVATILVADPFASSAPGASVGHGTGHANGHAPSPIHGNGHAHHPLEAALNAGPTASATWRALAGPVRTAAVPVGGYAPAAAVRAATREESFYLRFGKRMLDLVGALIALVLSGPLVLLAALAIKLESRGPVFYRSTRVGRGGRPFTFYKLRSMVNGADRHRHHLSHLNECDGPVFKISRDPRVTMVGRFLRTTSLDELPQLWNVLRGEMSLVGPRPPLPDEVSHYQPWQLRRLDVRPGITCLWQISGRSRIGFEEWMRLDLEYINRQSFPLDFQILLRTIPAVLSREGAY